MKIIDKSYERASELRTSRKLKSERQQRGQVRGVQCVVPLRMVRGVHTILIGLMVMWVVSADQDPIKILQQITRNHRMHQSERKSKHLEPRINIGERYRMRRMDDVDDEQKLVAPQTSTKKLKKDNIIRIKWKKLSKSSYDKKIKGNKIVKSEKKNKGIINDPSKNQSIVKVAGKKYHGTKPEKDFENNADFLHIDVDKNTLDMSNIHPKESTNKVDLHKTRTSLPKQKKVDYSSKKYMKKKVEKSRDKKRKQTFSNFSQRRGRTGLDYKSEIKYLAPSEPHSPAEKEETPEKVLIPKKVAKEENLKKEGRSAFGFDLEETLPSIAEFDDPIEIPDFHEFVKLESFEEPNNHHKKPEPVPPKKSSSLSSYSPSFENPTIYQKQPKQAPLKKSNYHSSYSPSFEEPNIYQKQYKPTSPKKTSSLPSYSAALKEHTYTERYKSPAGAVISNSKPEIGLDIKKVAEKNNYKYKKPSFRPPLLSNPVLTDVYETQKIGAPKLQPLKSVILPELTVADPYNENPKIPLVPVTSFKDVSLSGPNEEPQNIFEPEIFFDDGFFKSDPKEEFVSHKKQKQTPIYTDPVKTYNTASDTFERIPFTAFEPVRLGHHEPHIVVTNPPIRQDNKYYDPYKNSKIDLPGPQVHPKLTLENDVSGFLEDFSRPSFSTFDLPTVDLRNPSHQRLFSSGSFPSWSGTRSVREGRMLQPDVERDVTDLGGETSAYGSYKWWSAHPIVPWSSGRYHGA